MDVRIQQRLVGALVILALVFLIVPVVLDGDGRIPEKITQIPPKPKRPDLSHIRVAEPIADVLPPLPEQPPEQTVVQPSVERSESAASTTAAPDAGDTQPGTTTAETDDPASQGSAGRAWSVQVASFRDSSRAAELRDQLREQDYDTYVNEVMLSDGSLFTQVLVGPDADLERVRRLQGTIREQTGLQGLVVRYQP